MFHFGINNSFNKEFHCPIVLKRINDSVMFTQGMKFTTCPVAMGTTFFCLLNWSLQEKTETCKWLRQYMLIKLNFGKYSMVLKTLPLILSPNILC